MNWPGLWRGEALLTASLCFSALLGQAMVRFGLAQRILRPLKGLLERRGLAPELGLAMAVSVGSPKAASAMIAASYRDGVLSRPEALWGTLCLAFPAYLKRWPSSALTAWALAGRPGALFAAVLLLRSALRFLWCLGRIPRGSGGSLAEMESRRISLPLWRTLGRTLPLAWAFFALTYGLVPPLEQGLKTLLGGTLLPLSGWTVAASGLGSYAASLAAAGGGLASGELSEVQALFALLLGSGLGALSRSLRQNGAHWLGLFPLELARPLLGWQVASTAAVALLPLLVLYPFL